MNGFPKISLRAARVNSGLTLIEASEKLGISKPTLISYESKKSFPTFDVAEKICKVYNFPIEYISFT